MTFCICWIYAAIWNARGLANMYRDLSMAPSTQADRQVIFFVLAALTAGFGSQGNVRAMQRTCRAVERELRSNPHPTAKYGCETFETTKA